MLGIHTIQSSRFRFRAPTLDGSDDVTRSGLRLRRCFAESFLFQACLIGLVDLSEKVAIVGSALRTAPFAAFIGLGALSGC